MQPKVRKNMPNSLADLLSLQEQTEQLQHWKKADTIQNMS